MCDMSRLEEFLLGRRFLALKILLSAVIALAYELRRLHVSQGNLLLPWSWRWVASDDSFDVSLRFVKTILDTGWVAENPYLGAPFRAEYYDFPQAFLRTFDVLLIKILALFSQDAVLVANLFFLTTGVLIAVIAFLSLRAMGIADLPAMAGGQLYAFLPFFFQRNLEHGSLLAYEFLPLAVLLCLWIYEGKLKEKKSRLWAVFFCLLIGSTGGGYWQAFACFALVTTGCLAALDNGRLKAALPAVSCVAVILAVFALSMAPCALYRAEHGKNPNLVSAREALEADIYGLKVTQMILPDIRGEEGGWKGKISRYEETTPLVNENRTSYLGQIGSLGFLLSLLMVLGWRLQGEPGKRLFFLARLELSALLLAMIGGFYTLGAVFWAPAPMLRGLNRISVLIAFLSLAFFLILCQYVLDKLKEQRLRYAGGMFCLLAFLGLGLYFQFPRGFAFPYEAIKADFESDRSFALSIEAEAGEGAMIYQLPYHPYPEAGPAERMRDYHLMAPYFHTATLRWSYGAMTGRPAGLWQEKTAALPLPERMAAVREAGFSGVYIDRRAYREDELRQVEGTLDKLLGTKERFSANGNLGYWKLP